MFAHEVTTSLSKRITNDNPARAVQAVNHEENGTQADQRVSIVLPVPLRGSPAPQAGACATWTKYTFNNPSNLPGEPIGRRQRPAVPVCDRKSAAAGLAGA